MTRRQWDVFCRVVDNYGDAGVCWRLARQLAAEHAIDVTLWIDSLPTLARFEAGIDPQPPMQSTAGVCVRMLDDDSAVQHLPDVVIEGFGCGLPLRYLDAMAVTPTPPVWINLEYLSAEPWVDTVHGLASVQPRLPLTRHFWFPGFTRQTGGLIREAGLVAERDEWQARRQSGSGALRIVLFCYPNLVLPALFDAWSEADERIACVVPEGVATAALDRWLHADAPHAGQSVVRGRFALAVHSFVTQAAFDRLLWDADVNFVRGEDSFVRAQWAARAFIWQPYRQDEDAHRLKRDAFIARFATGLDADTRQSLSAFWKAFDTEDADAAVAAWPAFRAAIPALGVHGHRWAGELAAMPDLATRLVDFTRRSL